MAAPPALSRFRAEFGATLRLAAPLALANMLQMAVYASDVIFVARLGERALAASSLAVAIFSLVVFGLTGLTGAVAPLVAAEIGRRRNSVREVRRSVRMALWLAVASGLVGVMICLAGEAIMRLTGQDATLVAIAGGFLRLLGLAAVPMILANVLRITVATLGRPVFATLITALAIVVNAGGNWLLIFGNLGFPRLGLTGSAVATITTSLVTLAAYCAVVLADRRLRRFHLLGRWWRFDGERFMALLRIGLPIGATIVAEGGLFSSAAFLMGLLGDAELAAHAVALQIAAFFFQVPFGVAQAATIRVGYHHGARDPTGAGHAGWAALATGVAFSTLSGTLLLFAPRLVLSAYVDVAAARNVGMVALAVAYLAVAAAFQLFDGVQAIAAGALRGLQDTRVPMVIAIGGYWLGGFAVAVVLGLHTPLRGVGVWIGFAAGLGIVATLLVMRWSARGRIATLHLEAHRGIAVAAG